MSFILFNNKLINEDEFNPGKILLGKPFELDTNMWFANGEIRHFELHLQRLNAILQELNRPIPEEIPSPAELLRLSKRLINKNKAFIGGWLILTLFIGDSSNDYTVNIRTCPTRDLPLDATGKLAKTSSEIKFSANSLVRFPVFCQTIWEIEKLRLQGTRFDEAVFCNEKGFITEVIGANIYCVRKNSVITPAPETGCVIDLMRIEVLKAIENSGFQLVETKDLKEADLLEMEEIFTVSEAQGMQWLMGFDQKRYVKTKTELIWRQLNRVLLPVQLSDGFSGKFSHIL